MGYANYRIARPDQKLDKSMPRGYGVICKCHKRGCEAQIDRGMGYLCYSCTWYFCSEHLDTVFDGDDNPVEVSCFAGHSSQVCTICAKKLEKDLENESSIALRGKEKYNGPTGPFKTHSTKVSGLDRRKNSRKS